MSSAEAVTRTLRARGDLWQVAPGLIGLRGDTLVLFEIIEQSLARLAHTETSDEWRMPAAIPFATLARADYFASFPQWLSAASHLTDDEVALERMALTTDPGATASQVLAPVKVALQPALCYHTYAAWAGRVVSSPHVMTTQGMCWRHEDRFQPLARGWAFTMREIVCLGTAMEVEAFRERGRDQALAVADSFGLNANVVPATDPFFAPAGRGKAALQRIKGLKHELSLPIGPDRVIAAASFNNHELFFGERFDIRLRDGTPAASACVAFGLERWLLAVLVEHGCDARNWPSQWFSTAEVFA